MIVPLSPVLCHLKEVPCIKMTESFSVSSDRPSFSWLFFCMQAQLYCRIKNLCPNNFQSILKLSKHVINVHFNDHKGTQNCETQERLFYTWVCYSLSSLLNNCRALSCPPPKKKTCYLSSPLCTRNKVISGHSQQFHLSFFFFFP